MIRNLLKNVRNSREGSIKYSWETCRTRVRLCSWIDWFGKRRIGTEIWRARWSSKLGRGTPRFLIWGRVCKCTSSKLWGRKLFSRNSLNSLTSSQWSTYWSIRRWPTSNTNRVSRPFWARISPRSKVTQNIKRNGPLFTRIKMTM